MNNQQALVDQIVQNLAFEVEAVPRNKSVRTTSITQSTPLNVKIKVRKKDEIHTQHDLSSDANNTSRTVQKVRLVNSDRTIMTFDVFMEADFEKKPQRKLHKHIFDKLRPGICLRAVDDDEYPYLPSSSYSANITEPSTATRSDGTLKQTFTLSKNAYQTYPVSPQPGEHKWLFGKCRPGGCLDPPFSEEKYSYRPSTKTGPEKRKVEEENEDVECQVYSKIKPVPVHNEEVQSNGRHSSIFDSGLFKKKRKSSDKSTNTKSPDKSDSIVDLYQVDSETSSASTHSNSIITYPAKIRSDPRISHDKTVKSREPSEDKSRKSFNDHSEPLFVRPKGINHIKEKDTLNPSDYSKQRSPDATDLSNSRKEPFKMPVPLPIPIPVPIPLRSYKRKPETIPTNDDSLETRDENTKVTELDPEAEQELQEKINSKDNQPQNILPLNPLAETSTSKINDKSVESSKTSIPSKVEEPAIPNEIYDQDLNGAKLQPVQEIDSKNNIEDTAQIIKKSKIQPLKMAPVPVSFSEPNIASAVESKTPPTIKDTNLFEDSKDKQKNIDPVNRSEESDLTENTTPKSQYSEIEADAIPQNYLRTRGNFSEQIGDSENPLTEAPKMTENIKRESKDKEITEILQKPATQNDIKDTTASNSTEYLRTIGSSSEQVNDNENPVTEAPITTENIKRDSKEKDITYRIENPVAQNDDKDKEEKHSQRTSIPKLPVLQKSMSLLSGSKTAAPLVKDKTNRDDSADKRLYNLEYGDTDISNDKDEKHTSSPSRPENETDALNGKTSEPHKEDAGETTKSSKDHKIGSNTESQTRFIKEGNMNIITAPVIVDNTKLTPNFESRFKEVQSEIDPFGKTIITGPDFVISNELIGTKSVVYDEDGLFPTSVKKNTEVSPSPDKRVTPSIISTTTLKSALKKDTISLDLGFYSYLNDKNERILSTFDTGNAPKRSPNASVTVLKSQIRIFSNEIRIPVDSEHDMSIQIKKTNANQRVSISESGFVNVIDNGSVKKQQSPVQLSDVKTRSLETKSNENILESGAAENATCGNLIDYYEQELVPLQLVIKNLRDEIDVLATQQLIFKDKLFCPNKSKLPRMVHTNKKCFGCVRK